MELFEKRDGTKIIGIVEETHEINGNIARLPSLIEISSKLINSWKITEGEKMLYFAEDLYKGTLVLSHYSETIGALRDLIILKEMQRTEKYYQEVFKSCCSEVLGKEYIFYDKKDLQSKRPDLWVKKENEEIPIEMKIADFNVAALNQLEDYLKIYNCKHGIASGRRLTTKLPENITFIPLEYIEKYGWIL